MTNAEAQAVLGLPTRIAEAYAPRLAARQRMEWPVTTAAERLAVQTPADRGATFSCTSCGRFAFCEPTFCFWSRREAQ